LKLSIKLLKSALEMHLKFDFRIQIMENVQKDDIKINLYMNREKKQIKTGF